MLPARIVIFAGLQLAVCVYALRRGGAPERVVAIMMAAAAAMTAAVPFQHHNSFYVVQQASLVIDLTLLGGFVILAARADRFWPLWLAALQLLAIAIHGVRAYDPMLLPIVYARSAGEVAYPMIVLLAIGTMRHRQRVREHGAERDWSPLVWR